jgi:uncharacterized damage-inducible protein DinB
MQIKDLLLPEFDQEIATTRKLVALFPEDRLDWRPHPKSMGLQFLVSHIVNIPTWVPVTLEQATLDLMPEGKKWETPQVATRMAALASLEANMAAARASLGKASDEVMAETWTLLGGGKVLFSAPKSGVLRGFVFNHLVHHRAQLGVYLRLLDVPLPGSYGPSADEQMG